VRPVEASILQDPIFKITRAKWTRGEALTVQHLLCKCEVLSSYPSPTRGKKNLKKQVHLQYGCFYGRRKEEACEA
jgi:hypothetical protein